MEDPKNNKFLTFNKDVKRTPQTDVVIAKLEKYFAQKGHYAKITSVYRNKEQQLETIRFYVSQRNIDTYYPEMIGCKVEDKTKIDNEEVYKWQRCWSKLLNVGFLINPPIKAKVLFNYIKNGVNKKGTYIEESLHQTGLAFDIGGSLNGVNDEVEIVSFAIANDPNLGIRNMVIERANNCLHCNVKLTSK